MGGGGGVEFSISPPSKGVYVRAYDVYPKIEKDGRGYIKQLNFFIRDVDFHMHTRSGRDDNMSCYLLMWYDI